MRGKVYLVGAGPGNEGLITARGLELIRKAEVLVYDRLAGSQLVMEAPMTCEKIYVGKISNNHAMKQEDINQLLVDKALENKCVVRLKGGDPYVFGRGGEEGLKLYENQIEFEVVPGITSPIGGLCYAGIPITHRDYASSFHVITGHLKADGEAHDWEALARLRGTLVFLMGMANLQNITERLMNHGKDATTPVAIVHWASHPNQQVVEGTLSSIVEEVEKAGVTSPSLIVVGDVVKLRNPLNFFERKPLHGKRILITRATTQNSSMVEKIRNLGGVPVVAPMIAIEKLHPEKEIKRVMEGLKHYQYLIFTSMNGIERFFEEIDNHGLDTRALAGIKIVCVGRPTEKHLQKYGIKADLVPDRFVAEGILELLKPHLNETDRILVPRARGARPLLVDELQETCHVDELHLYESSVVEVDWADVESHYKSIDYVTFTSASTVRNFVKQTQGLNLFNQAKYMSIGPITSKEMAKFDLTVHSEAEPHTIDGLIERILATLEEEK